MKAALGRLRPCGEHKDAATIHLQADLKRCSHRLANLSDRIELHVAGRQMDELLEESTADLHGGKEWSPSAPEPPQCN